MTIAEFSKGAGGGTTDSVGGGHGPPGDGGRGRTNDPPAPNELSLPHDTDGIAQAEEQRTAGGISNRLPVLAQEILDQHVGVRMSGAEFVRHAVEAGRRLIEAKDIVGHGNFESWVAANLPGVSIRTCQKYMKAAKRAGKNEPVRFSSLRHLIGPPKPRAVAEPRVVNGKTIWPPSTIPEPRPDHMILGRRKGANGYWDEIWIAPSAEHPGFYFAGRLCGRDGCGGHLEYQKKPIRGDAVRYFVELGASTYVHGMTWEVLPCPGGWDRNIVEDDPEWLDPEWVRRHRKGGGAT